MEHERSFKYFMSDVSSLIQDNKYEHNAMGRSIRSIGFTVEEIWANDDYFKECYKNNMTPEEAVESLGDNNDNLLRYIEHIPNKFILDEVHNRYIIHEILSETDTDDLEDELRDRWDTSMVDKNHLSTRELKEMLFERGKPCAYGEPKDIICELLGFCNSYAVTYEEAIKELKKFF